jgi:drug/metabolite transporter (DMT)-like permease
MSRDLLQIFGCSIALISALAWAIGSILFQKIGDKASALGINLVKASLGLIYLGIVMLITGIHPVNMRSFLWLGASGLVGIAVGDTLFFKTLIYLGPKLTVLLEPLGPVVTIAMAYIFLGEKLSALGWIGAILTLSGVSIVLWKSTPEKKTHRNWIPGIICSVLSTLCMSAGIIFAKIGLKDAYTIDATFVRLLWAVGGLFIFGSATKRLAGCLSPFKEPRLAKLILGSTAVVIFGGFWLSLVALKYVSASIATILGSTTPIWILPVTAIALKEKISIHEIIGSCIAVIGVVLIFIG